MDEIVNRLNPTYIGFLLNLYKPFFMKTVLSLGNPKRVDFPKFIRLNIVNKKPTDRVKYETFSSHTKEIILISTILKKAKIYSTQIIYPYLFAIAFQLTFGGTVYFNCIVLFIFIKDKAISQESFI